MFHNGSNYHYHFTIKELAEEFEGQFEYFTEKYKTFSVPIKKENENHKTITYEIKFLESLIFMASLLSSLADNLVEGLRKEKCKNCKSDLEYMAGNGGSL